MDLDKTQIDDYGYETATSLIKGFDAFEKSGEQKSVLIFLPGIYEIEEMHRHMTKIMISEYKCCVFL